MRKKGCKDDCIWLLPNYKSNEDVKVYFCCFGQYYIYGQEFETDCESYESYDKDRNRKVVSNGK